MRSGDLGAARPAPGYSRPSHGVRVRLRAFYGPDLIDVFDYRTAWGTVNVIFANPASFSPDELPESEQYASVITSTSPRFRLSSLGTLGTDSSFEEVSRELSEWKAADCADDYPAGDQVGIETDGMLAGVPASVTTTWAFYASARTEIQLRATPDSDTESSEVVSCEAAID